MANGCVNCMFAVGLWVLRVMKRGSLSKNKGNKTRNGYVEKVLGSLLSGLAAKFMNFVGKIVEKDATNRKVVMPWMKLMLRSFVLLRRMILVAITTVSGENWTSKRMGYASAGNLMSSFMNGSIRMVSLTLVVFGVLHLFCFNGVNGGGYAADLSSDKGSNVIGVGYLSWDVYHTHVDVV
ncbi:hypothetical protein Tco_1148569 [Tanacetum coccineum]